MSNAGANFEELTTVRGFGAAAVRHGSATLADCVPSSARFLRARHLAAVLCISGAPIYSSNNLTEASCDASSHLWSMHRLAARAASIPPAGATGRPPTKFTEAVMLQKKQSRMNAERRKLRISEDERQVCNGRLFCMCTWL